MPLKFTENSQDRIGNYEKITLSPLSIQHKLDNILYLIGQAVLKNQ